MVTYIVASTVDTIIMFTFCPRHLIPTRITSIVLLQNGVLLWLNWSIVTFYLVLIVFSLLIVYRGWWCLQTVIVWYILLLPLMILLVLRPFFIHVLAVSCAMHIFTNFSNFSGVPATLSISYISISKISSVIPKISLILLIVLCVAIVWFIILISV